MIERTSREYPMKIADYTSQREAKVNLTVSYHSAIDLLLALWIIGERMAGEGLADLDLGSDWFDDLEARMSDKTRGDLEDVGTGDVWIGLVALLPEAGQGGSVQDFLDFLGSYDPVDLRFRLSQCYDLFDERYQDLIADAAEGKQGALDEFLALEEFSKPSMARWAGTLRALLGMDPQQTKDKILGVLTAFQEDVFAQYEKAFRHNLESDFESKRAMTRRLSPQRVIEIATSGITLSGHHAARPIVLMPSMVARPWVVVSAGPDFNVYAYSVSDESLEMDPDAPAPWLLKAFKALGDERRLRILRKLGESDASLAELSQEFDIGKSTLHHHLMLLRAAGLIGIHMGDTKRYSLRRDTMTEAASSLDYYLDPKNRRKDSPQ
ncbi:MAG: winged helix-turn-helix domain-containing protein [Actinomycetota bacterium]